MPTFKLRATGTALTGGEVVAEVSTHHTSKLKNLWKLTSPYGQGCSVLSFK